MTTNSRVLENREVRRPDDTAIHYTASGPTTGPAAVLVHGWACNRTDFDALTSYLPDDQRVLAVDLAEHGDSRSTREDWTMRAFAYDVVAVLEAESVDECVVVGHSMGGAVAVEVARLLPAVVRHVVALDALHYLFLFGGLDDEQAAATVRPAHEDFAGLVRTMVEAGSPPGTDPALKDAYFAKMSAVRQPGGTQAFEGLVAWNMEEALAETEQPITLLGVRELVSAEAVSYLRDRVEIVLVDLGSHHFHRESPEGAAELIVQVVKRSRSAG